MNILITVPDLTEPGGVASLYNILDFDNEKNVSYFSVHGKKKQKIGRTVQLLFIYMRFCIKCRNVNVVHINPSLNRSSFIRDGIFVLIAKLMGKKALVYWHGWTETFEKDIHKSPLKKMFFRHTFGRSDMHIVLGRIFEQKLSDLGINKGLIIRESNAADNSYLSNDYEKQPLISGEVINILFLSRLEQSKGVYIAIDAIKILAESANIKLIIAGNGSEEKQAKEYAGKLGLSNIVFAGYVEGKAKHEILKDSHILLLPSFSEGMPISILEGMMYGLPIISRPIGGIPDWVTEGENGYLIESLEPIAFAESMQKIISTPDIFHKMSIKNNKTGISNFTPVAVRERLLSYYKSLSA